MFDNEIMDDGIDVNRAIEKDMASHKAFIALKYANIFRYFSSFKSFFLTSSLVYAVSRAVHTKKR